MRNEQAINHLRIWADSIEKASNSPHVSELLRLEIKEDADAMKMAIAALEKQANSLTGGWIPVEQGLPEDGQVVNVITKSKSGKSDSNGLDIVIYRQTSEGGAFCTAAENNDLEIYGMHVTHWAPLPDLPTEEEGGGTVSLISHLTDELKRHAQAYETGDQEGAVTAISTAKVLREAAWTIEQQAIKIQDNTKSEAKGEK